MDFAATWQGRGGTDFRGLIQAGAEAEPQVILYLTDGFGTLPQEVPNVPIVWVLNRQCWTGTDGTLYDYNCKELRRFGEITSMQDP
ncbi:MAG: VWA-like domain-containing protein [Deltaproteobacteria bacterium]|nr:VWA-like domain-containing protein [Deltaproteobacteria bacterium]